MSDPPILRAVSGPDEVGPVADNTESAAEIKTLRVLPGNKQETPEMKTGANEVLRFVSIEDQRKDELIEVLNAYIEDVKKGFVTSLALVGHGKLIDGGAYLRTRVLSTESSTFIKGMAQELVDYAREITEHGREQIERDDEEPQ